MIARYVVGIDGSRPAEAALDWALARAERDRAALSLIHVADSEWGLMGAEYGKDSLESGRWMLATRLAEVRAAHPDLQIDGQEIEGGAPWALTQFVALGDVLVVGTHKTGYLHGRVLGSRSVQVAAAAPCTVVVVPEIDLSFRRGIVAGIDRDDTAAAIAHFAAEEAASTEQELILVHSSPGTSASASTPEPLATALEAARALAPGLHVRARTSIRPPAAALLDTSRMAKLLVLGPGSLDPTRSPIGSVVHDVLMNINAPVMVVHGDDARERMHEPVGRSRAPRPNG